MALVPEAESSDIMVPVSMEFNYRQQQHHINLSLILTEVSVSVLSRHSTTRKSLVGLGMKVSEFRLGLVSDR